MSIEKYREVIGRLSAAANALAAVGVALQPNLALSAERRSAIDAVLSTLGLNAGEAMIPAVTRSLLGEIRLALLQAAQRVRQEQAPGWNTTDPEVLQAAGDVSASFPSLLQRMLPELPGLSQSLSPEGARFLDVGVGVAALSIEMARLWPRLRIVGIDVWQPALALARENVRDAGLEVEERIELRHAAVQDLTDTHAFDLAWLPSAFIPASVIPQALRRVHRALRPGGWLLFASLDPGQEPSSAALARLRALEWGATSSTRAEVQALLQDSGFRDLRTLGPPGSAALIVAGRAGG